MTRNEINQLLPRSARVPSECPIHIIMERTTCKTIKCYVEFRTPEDARYVYHRILNTFETKDVTSGYPVGPRIGSRAIDISISDQDTLQKSLFPLAKYIRWTQGIPVLTEIPENERWSIGFKDFLTDEEMFCMRRAAENPGRVCVRVFHFLLFGRNFVR